MDTRTTFHLLSPISVTQFVMLAVAVIVLYGSARAVAGSPLGPARKPVLWVLRGLILAALAVILANPVRVDRSPGQIERSDVLFLLDASASMALGDSMSRFAQAVRVIRDADRLVPPEEQPGLSVYRFGGQLAALDSPPLDRLEAISPTDADTRLLSALRQLVGRFHATQTRAVVLFSDGRVREPTDVQQMARRYAELSIPIHVVPVGQHDRGGDVAVVNMVAPAQVRKQSQVEVTVWVRGYGYDGLRSELVLEAIDRTDESLLPLSRLPITLTGGIQTFHLTFPSDPKSMRVRASIPPRPDEVSPRNNAASAEIAVDRTKIRVLYVEGGDPGFRQPQLPDLVGRVPQPHAVLPAALTDDPDIECMTVLATSGPLGVAAGAGAFPETRAQLFAYDAIILSSVPRGFFTDEQLALMEEWVRERGAGLCMAGGPRSFTDGGWGDSAVAAMLPAVCAAVGRSWISEGRLAVRPDPEALGHPVWNIVADARLNANILASLPPFTMFHRGLSAKQTAQVLATGMLENSTGESGEPVLVAGPYGKGRTMAMAVSLGPQWSPAFASQWGESDNRYYAKLLRNTVYWLTEHSYLGRRRLAVACDKMSYQPGETIQVTAHAYDETSIPATNLRVTVSVLPQSLDAELNSDEAPVRWPDGVERPSGEASPYVTWGEEMEMLAPKGDPCYTLELPIAEQLTAGVAAEALRLEVSAYDETVLIDSTSVDAQILDDPFEYRNPLPDLVLLDQIARLSGGQTLTDAESLAAMLRALPAQVGPEEVRQAPLWSRWWVLSLLLALLTIEWIWRRNLGLA